MKALQKMNCSIFNKITKHFPEISNISEIDWIIWNIPLKLCHKQVSI